jgi:quercetin dioxygenase-like cupin family protein
MRIGKALPLLVVVITAALGATARAEPMLDAKIENLFQTALAKEFTPGREIIVALVEVPPNTSMERHWHPGEEFHYCLEGETELVIDGQPTVMETPGKVSHVPYKKMHTVITKTKGAKLLVFRVHTEGEPVRHLEKGGTEKK